MEATIVFRDLFGRAREALAPIGGLSDDELYAEPRPSIAWYAWRMGRCLDANISGLMAMDQLWMAGGWHERFGMTADPRDFLPGFPPPNDIVHSFRAPSTQLILDYFDAAHERTTSYLATLGPEDLDRELNEPQHDPLPTVSVRLVSVSVALAQSSGPIRYRLWLAGKGR